MANSLTKEEFDRWRQFRFMVEETSLAVSRSLLSSTGISGGQFGILSILVDRSHCPIRQQELAHAMRWDRTRLSHQLTRMAASGWIQRQKQEGATLVSITASGRKEHQKATPVMTRILRERFLGRLSQAQFDALQEIRRALAIEGPEDDHSQTSPF